MQSGVDALSSLFFKMAIIAAVVVIAAMVAERTRPALAALIATLPFSIGPTYILLAMEQPPAFISAAALKSVPGACATIVFIVAYTHAILRFRPLPAVGVAYLAWVPAALVGHAVDWSVAGVVALSVATIGAAHLLTRSLRNLRPSGVVTRSWIDIPVRAIGVALLVGGVTGLSTTLGSSGVGVLANFPIIMSSLGLIMHWRLGANAAAGMLANAIGGMAGICAALLSVHLTFQPLGAVLSLSLGLVLCIVWNLVLFRLGQLSRRSALSR